jgi:hypothetical protein
MVSLYTACRCLVCQLLEPYIRRPKNSLPDGDSAPQTTQWLDLKWLSIRILPPAALLDWAACSYRPARLTRGIESNQFSTSAPTRLKIRDRGGMRRLRM